LKPQLMLAALALLMTNGAARTETRLTDAQKDMLKTFATVKLLADECPIYKENTDGLIQQAVNVGLTPEDFRSGEAKTFVRLAVSMLRSGQLASKTDTATICVEAWADFGAAGKVKPDLLLKR
jgi:hypothetical protein